MIAPNGNEARLLKLLRDGSIRACVNEDILAEYQQVLLREKFGYAARIIAPLLADYIVTGNLRDFPEAAYGTAIVVNGAEFLNRIESSV